MFTRKRLLSKAIRLSLLGDLIRGKQSALAETAQRHGLSSAAAVQSALALDRLFKRFTVLEREYRAYHEEYVWQQQRIQFGTYNALGRAQ
ncbi:MAG: hypothetical protein LBR85_01210 [Oscillospiraceae bacterium]|jgi:hypothetical protein|nr:hypothetical protein [Oscillospiraceae bacterium]